MSFYDSSLFDPFAGKFDPFKGDPVQSKHVRALCRVIVDGTDITNKLEPHLISVRILDESLSKCEIEIDDRDAKLPLPPLGAPVQVELGWLDTGSEQVFSGVIQDLEYGFGRKQGGRRMWVHAEGLDYIGTNIKTPMQNSLGEGAPPGQEQGIPHSLVEWLTKVAPTADAVAKVSGKFASVIQDYWHQDKESWAQMVQGLGEKHGAMVQFKDGNVTHFMAPGEGGSCQAIWGVNLIGCRIRPFNARAAWGGANQEVFNWRESAWKLFSGNFKGFVDGLAKGTFSLPQAAPNDQSAQADNQGASDQQANMMGHGRIVINGEPKAVFNGHCDLQGLRSGVDGDYLIWTAEHQWSRQGYITFLDVTPFSDAQRDALSSAAAQTMRSFYDQNKQPVPAQPGPTTTP